MGSPLIWGALVVPLVTMLVLLLFFKRKMAWWEYILPLVVGIIVIGGCKLLSTFAAYDKEYWGSSVASAEYDEEWNERKTRTVKDKKGTHTESYTETHHADWRAKCSDGETISIDSDQFEGICRRFRNRQFVDMHRAYHTRDGDRYVTQMRPGCPIIPVTTVHRYLNKVAHSHSVFNFREVDPKKYRLYDYPDHKDFFAYPCILGDTMGKAEAEKRLAELNAELGPKCQVRMWILIFRNKPYQAGVEQEAYWKGGNKNEFIVCAGIDRENNVQWAKVISWTDVTVLKVACREFVRDQKKLDLNATVEWLAENIPGQYKRKHFRDFNYLSVDPPGWMIALTYFLVILASAGVSIYATRNQYDEDGKKKPSQSAPAEIPLPTAKK